MQLRTRLAFGPLGAIVLCLGVAGTSLLVPGYSHVHRTVSEIGQVGSPARVPFTLMVCLVAVCLWIFASGLKQASHNAGHSPLAAYFVAAMGISAMGVGIFAYPNPMHNVFGLSELIGYQAPLVFALTWRRDSRSSIVTFSWVMYVLVMLAVAANLAAMDDHGAIWTLEEPVYGIVQRSLFATWFAWCVGIGGLLLRRTECIEATATRMLRS